MNKIVAHFNYLPGGLKKYIPSTQELVGMIGLYFNKETILGPGGSDGSFGVIWEGRPVTFGGYFIVKTDSGDKYIDMNVDIVSAIRNKSIESITQ